jgi:hypothetical protein
MNMNFKQCHKAEDIEPTNDLKLAWVNKGPTIDQIMTGPKIDDERRIKENKNEILRDSVYDLLQRDKALRLQYALILLFT